MNDDGGLEEHVERETGQAVHHQRWFIRQSFIVRLLVALSIATLLTCFAAAMYFGITAFTGESTGPSFWVPLAACGVVLLAIAITAAIDPVRYARANARAMGMFPTRAPGYGDWAGRDRAGRDHQRDSSSTD